MVQRLTYRRRHCYATKSNKVRKVKTPGALLGQQITQESGPKQALLIPAILRLASTKCVSLQSCSGGGVA